MINRRHGADVWHGAPHVRPSVRLRIIPKSGDVHARRPRHHAPQNHHLPLSYPCGRASSLCAARRYAASCSRLWKGTLYIRGSFPPPSEYRSPGLRQTCDGQNGHDDACPSSRGKSSGKAFEGLKTLLRIRCAGCEIAARACWERSGVWHRDMVTVY